MSNSRFILTCLMLLALCSLLAQLVIDFSAVNIASACIVFASAMLVLLYLMWTPAIHTHPLSTFAIFGFCVTTQLGALVAQTASWTPLALNLQQPMATFGTLAMFQALAMLAHTGYRLVLNPPGNVSASSLFRTGLTKLGLYTPPSTGALWIMGLIGFVSVLFGKGGEGTASKVLQGMNFLTWAPFLIPMYLLQNGASYCNPRKQYPFLILFASLIVLLGMAANARGMVLSGFVTIGLFALLMALRSFRTVSPALVLRLTVLGLVLGALSAPVSDLATAMVIARKVRGNVSPVQMVQETLYYMGQPAALKAQREAEKSASQTNTYDEFYFANPLVARLVETKFHDNALYFASRLSGSDVDLLAETTVDFLWASLPDPALKALRSDLDKKDLRFSMGDYLGHLSQGGPLGGYRTGSMLAQGLALLGLGFGIVYFFGCLLMFAVLDLLSSRHPSGQVVLSAVGMLGVWKLFQYGISAESLHTWMGLMARAIPQNILIFLLLSTLARFGASALGRLSSGDRSHQTLATR